MATFEDTLPGSADVIVQKLLTDVQRELNQVDNPNQANVFLDSSWLRAIPTALGFRLFDNVLQLEQAIKLNMPDTAEGDFVDRWGSIYVGTRNAAVGSSGVVVATGTAGSIVTLGANYQSSDGIVYIVTSATTLTAEVLSVTSITRVSNTATVTTATAHGLASNIEVTIAGAVQTDYNGDFEIQVNGETTFTYTVDNVPTTPATGTITAAFTAGSVPIDAVPPADPDDPFGQATNQILDTPLDLQVTIAGVDVVANVDFQELTGGTDEEGDVTYKNRYLDKIQNPVSHFSVPDIEQQIFDEVPGVTRIFINKSGDPVSTLSVTSINLAGTIATVVTATAHDLFTGANVTISGAVEPEYNVTDAIIFVVNATTYQYLVSGSPSSPATGTIVSDGLIGLGFVQIYFVRDDDDDPIPSVLEVQDVKDAVLEITPANTPDVFIEVLAPTAAPTDFTFTELTPDSTTMRTAVTAQLQQFFDEQVTVGGNVDEDAYRSAIFTTIDTESGLSVTSFELSVPSGDLVTGVGELPTLGTVTYP